MTALSETRQVARQLSVNLPRFNLSRFWHFLGAAGFGLGLWQIVAVIVSHTRGVPFPNPLDCAQSLFNMLHGSSFLDYTIYQHVLASCSRWFYGFATAFIAAFVYAFLAHRHPLFKKISLPTVEVLQLVPGLAWAPVVILLFGLGSTATWAIITLTTFPVITRAALAGFASARPEHLRMASSLGHGFWGLWRYIYLPASLPQLLSGTRIALGVSWRVLVAAEMVIGGGEGLGLAIIQSRWTMDYASAFACISVIAALGLAIERFALLPLEKRTIARWGMEHAS